MPIYDYACSACGHVTEVVHGINDHGPKFCPECGAEGTMTKNFTTPAIHFKGTDVAEAYEDVVSRFLGEDVPLRFTSYEKPGFLQRIFGVK